jgi:Cu(I)/Ag(I) efflux system membrane fusion protein
MLNPKTRTTIARLRFDNINNELKPNMFAQISIDTGSNESALQIPKEALIRTGMQNRVVLALGEGSFKSVEVKVGRYNNNKVEILAGLPEGERVVSSAQFLLDSESSKSSDFKRMNADDSDKEKVQSAVWVQAEIESITPEENMLTLNHEPIPEWDWPEMMMDFTVIDTINFSQLKEGTHLRAKLNKKASGGYQIIDIELPEATLLNQTSSSFEDGTAIDHSNH